MSNKREPGSGCSAISGLDRGNALLGGSTDCVAVYPGDWAIALVAFDAQVDVIGSKGQRTIPVEQFFVGPGSTPMRENVLDRDELIVRIRVPTDRIGRASTYHKVGDTRVTPQHLTAGSWGTATAIPAVSEAAEAISQRLSEISTGGPNRHTPAQVLQKAGLPSVDVEIRRKALGQPDQIFGRLITGLPAAAGPIYPDFVTFSYIAHFVEVRLEPNTRRIRVPRVVGVADCGHVVSPRTAASQVRGGVVWGIGATLREASEIDPRFGGFLNADLAEYALPVNADIGSIEVDFIDKPDPLVNSVGVKGLGEVAMVGVAPAIVNAVFHATGKRLRDLPIRIEHVL